MKTIFGILTLCSVALASSAATTATKKKAAAVPAGPTAQVLTIPKDAIANPDGTFTWTDKDGKKYQYAKTPFGVMRSVVDPTSSSGSESASAAALKFTKATDKGDTVRFERTTPFGPVIWEKKKTELTDEEKSLVEQTAKLSDTNAH